MTRTEMTEARADHKLAVLRKLYDQARRLDVRLSFARTLFARQPVADMRLSSRSGWRQRRTDHRDAWFQPRADSLLEVGGVSARTWHNCFMKPTISMATLVFAMGVITFAIGTITMMPAQTQTDRQTVADLDTQYQDAVRRNDAATMAKILADDFVLVSGIGKTSVKADFISEAHSGDYVYEGQEDSNRIVRVWGDTAVVTAKLWAKGTYKGKSFDYKVWFSDTYVRRPQGWKYVFAQVSTRLPAD
jgi:ketosteroid isomerase-like protein